MWELGQKVAAGLSAALHIYGVKKRIKADPNRFAYMDQALMPVTEEEVDTLELFTQNEAARHAVQHARHVRELTHAAG